VRSVSFCEHAFAPVTNVGNALIHGDITGGQYQAGGSDYLKTALAAGAVAAPFVAGPALAGLGGEAAAAGATGAGLGTAGIDAAALSPDIAATAGTYGGELAGIPGAGFAPAVSPLDAMAASPNAYVAQGFGALPAGTPGTALSLAPTAPGVSGSIDADVLGATLGAPGSAPLSIPAAAAAPGAAGAAPWYAGIPGATTLANMSPTTLAALGIGGAGLLGGQKIGQLFNPQLPDEQNLRNIAGAEQNQFQTLSAEGQALEQPLLTGQLPLGWQTVIDQQLNQIRAQYARLGLSGSTMEQQDLATAQTTGALSIAQQLAQSGQTLIGDATQALGADADVYKNLMTSRIAQDTATQQTFGQFAGALALAGGLSARNPTTAATSSTSV